MFRRSGSAVTYFYDGALPSPQSDEFAAALANHRFRTIESAASEEVSIGWVTAGDPTGDTFELEDMDLENGIWLQIRCDKKALPSAWLRIHRSVAERSAGRPLSARERRDLKADLCEQLLPRLLPSVQFIDVLIVPKQNKLLLFGTSTRVREEFEKLFFKTFAVPLEVADPYTLAARAGLGREATAYLDEVTPVPWPGTEPNGHASRSAEPLEVLDGDPLDDTPEPAEIIAEAEAAAEIPAPEADAAAESAVEPAMGEAVEQPVEQPVAEVQAVEEELTE